MKSGCWHRFVLVATIFAVGQEVCAESRKQDLENATAAYQSLLALFPQDCQGFGKDHHRSAIAHQPMTYGLVLSAEAVHLRNAPSEESRRRVRKATRWLLDNSDLDGDGLPGWGLPQLNDPGADGTVNPENHPYTITTSIVLNGLMDALAIPDLWTNAERDEIRTLMAEVVLRWCRNIWSEGFGGGYFWYSPNVADNFFSVNAPSMYLGSIARLLHDHADALTPPQRRLVQDRADLLAKAIVSTASLQDGAPYWHYVAVPNKWNRKKANDLVHHVYILWGIESYRDYGGRVRLPWTRAQAVESVDRFWQRERMCAYPQGGNAGREAGSACRPPRLWSAGMMLAFYAKWGDQRQALRVLDAIREAYGPWPRLRWRTRDDPRKNGSFYPRHAAHVLFGLALCCFG